MRQVQEALKDIGIPVMAGVWRATSANQNPPTQYAVYSTTTTEAAHQDDRVTAYRTYVYLNLWSDIDPTDTATTQFTVQWTWCLQTEVTPGAP